MVSAASGAESECSVVANDMTSPKSLPQPRECPFAPPAAYESWRAGEAVTRVDLPGGAEAWVLTRHEDARELLSSKKVTRRPMDTEMRSGAREGGLETNLLHMDEPVHGEHRRMLVREFSGKTIAAMRPGIEAIADGYIDSMLAAGNSADLVKAFCMPVPSTVICQLLGVPYSDHEYFEGLSSTITDLRISSAEFNRANSELIGYMDALIAEKEKAPTDDLLGRLIVSRVRTDEMTRDQLVGLARLLLIAGFETTAIQFAMGVLHVCSDDDLRAKLVGNPELWPGAVEEMVRMDSVSDTIPVRTALEDFEVGGCPIRAGEGVIPLLAAVNHDPAVFEEPGRFDALRNARAHLGFGGGIHSCLGQNLARLELEIGLKALFTRVPMLRLDPGLSEVPFNHEAMVFGPTRLTASW